MALRENTAICQKRQHYLALGLLCVVVLGVLAVYMPNRRLLSETRQKIAVAQANAAANAQRVTALPKLIADVKQLRNQVDRYKPLLGRSDVERAMDEISTIKESTSVSNYGFKTLKENLRPSCVEQPLEITFSADFVDAVSLIQRIESMNRLTRLRELSIKNVETSGKGDRGVVNVQMKVSLFYADTVQ